MNYVFPFEEVKQKVSPLLLKVLSKLTLTCIMLLANQKFKTAQKRTCIRCVLKDQEEK